MKISKWCLPKVCFLPTCFLQARKGKRKRGGGLEDERVEIAVKNRAKRFLRKQKKYWGRKARKFRSCEGRGTRGGGREEGGVKEIP